MLEVKNEISDQSDIPNDSPINLQFKDLKLPKIEHIPSYERHKKTTNTKLPLIKNRSCSDYNSQDIDQSSDMDDFVVSVEKRLRMIIQEQNITEVQESDESGQDNFVRKINENKQIIKQLRRRNQQNQKQNGQANTVEKANPKYKGIPMLSHRHNVLFKKHQLKDRSLDDKSDKKAIFHNFAKRQSWKEKIKITTPLKEELESIHKEIEGMPRQLHLKDGLTLEDKILPMPNHKKHSLFGKRKLAKQFSHKILTPVQKNEQLFDAIHNYLQNPKRSEQMLNPIKVCRNKEELSQKLRQYQQKLTQLQYSTCVKKAQKENKESDKVIGGSTNSHWRKISLNCSGLLLQESSSFDDEIERMNVYVKRNDKSLEKYVQNQKMLLDMQLAHRERLSTEKDVMSSNFS